MAMASISRSSYETGDSLTDCITDLDARLKALEDKDAALRDKYPTLQDLHEQYELTKILILSGKNDV